MYKFGDIVLLRCFVNGEKSRHDVSYFPQALIIGGPQRTSGGDYRYRALFLHAIDDHFNTQVHEGNVYGEEISPPVYRGLTVNQTCSVIEQARAAIGTPIVKLF